MKRTILSLAAAAALLGAGCATAPSYVDLNDPSQRGPVSTGLEYQDFEKAAVEATKSMLESGAVSKPDGGRYVLMVGRIKNDTTQNIRGSQLVTKITTELRNSGKVVVTAAFDQSSVINQGADEMAQDDRFNQATVAKTQLVAPELELKGSILERNLTISSRKKRTEYYFHLQLIQISTGLVFWEGETPILKQGANRTNW